MNIPDPCCTVTVRVLNTSCVLRALMRVALPSSAGLMTWRGPGLGFPLEAPESRGSETPKWTSYAGVPLLYRSSLAPAMWTGSSVSFQRISVHWKRHIHTGVLGLGCAGQNCKRSNSKDSGELHSCQLLRWQQFQGSRQWSTDSTNSTTSFQLLYLRYSNFGSMGLRLKRANEGRYSGTSFKSPHFRMLGLDVDCLRQNTVVARQSSNGRSAIWSPCM
jgi:hypothetical protein